MNINVFARNGGKGHVSMGKFSLLAEKKKKNMIGITSGDVRSNNCTSRYIDEAA